MDTVKTIVDKGTKVRGRPRAFNHDEALDSALKVFWSRGYEGASLNELTAALGINRPSLYAAFGNKEELFRKALARYMQGPVAYAAEALKEPTARQVVETFLTKSVELLANPDNPSGCMIVLGALACGEGSEIIRQELISRRMGYQAALTQRFEQARTAGDLPADENPAALARYVTTVHQGMSVQANSGASREELLSIVATAMKNWPSA
ncbi:MAG: TetR/AcrR family transcriptional regulator [Methylophilaceae bacterium]